MRYKNRLTKLLILLTIGIFLSQNIGLAEIAYDGRISCLKPPTTLNPDKIVRELGEKRLRDACIDVLLQIIEAQRQERPDEQDKEAALRKLKAYVSLNGGFRSIEAAEAGPWDFCFIVILNPEIGGGTYIVGYDAEGRQIREKVTTSSPAPGRTAVTLTAFCPFKDGIHLRPSEAIGGTCSDIKGVSSDFVINLSFSGREKGEEKRINIEDVKWYQDFEHVFPLHRELRHVAITVEGAFSEHVLVNAALILRKLVTDAAFEDGFEPRTEGTEEGSSVRLRCGKPATPTLLREEIDGNVVKLKNMAKAASPATGGPSTGPTSGPTAGNEEPFKFAGGAYNRIPDLRRVTDREFKEAFNYIKTIFAQVNDNEGGIIKMGIFGYRSISEVIVPTCLVWSDGKVELNNNFVRLVACLMKRGLGDVPISHPASDRTSNVLDSIIYSVALHEIRGHFRVDKVSGTVQFVEDERLTQMERGVTYRGINLTALFYYWFGLVEGAHGDELERRVREFMGSPTFRDHYPEEVIVPDDIEALVTNVMDVDAAVQREGVLRGLTYRDPFFGRRIDDPKKEVERQVRAAKLSRWRYPDNFKVSANEGMPGSRGAVANRVIEFFSVKRIITTTVDTETAEEVARMRRQFGYFGRSQLRRLPPLFETLGLKAGMNFFDTGHGDGSVCDIAAAYVGASNTHGREIRSNLCVRSLERRDELAQEIPELANVDLKHGDSFSKENERLWKEADVIYCYFPWPDDWKEYRDKFEKYCLMAKPGTKIIVLNSPIFPRLRNFDITDQFADVCYKPDDKRHLDRSSAFRIYEIPEAIPESRDAMLARVTPGDLSPADTGPTPRSEAESRDRVELPKTPSPDYEPGKGESGEDAEEKSRGARYMAELLCKSKFRNRTFIKSDYITLWRGENPEGEISPGVVDDDLTEATERRWIIKVEPDRYKLTAQAKEDVEKGLPMAAEVVVERERVTVEKVCKAYRENSEQIAQLESEMARAKEDEYGKPKAGEEIIEVRKLESGTLMALRNELEKCHRRADRIVTEIVTEGIREGRASQRIVRDLLKQPKLSRLVLDELGRLGSDSNEPLRDSYREVAQIAARILGIGTADDKTPTATHDLERKAVASAKRRGKVDFSQGRGKVDFSQGMREALQAMFEVAGAEECARRLKGNKIKLRWGKAEIEVEEKIEGKKTTRKIEKGATNERLADGTYEVVVNDTYLEAFEDYLGKDELAAVGGERAQEKMARDHLLKTARNVGHELGETRAKDYLVEKYGDYDKDDPVIEAAGILSEILIYIGLLNALSKGEDPWHDFKLANAFNEYMKNISPHLASLRGAIIEEEEGPIEKLIEAARNSDSIDSRLGAILNRRLAALGFAELDEHGFEKLREIIELLIPPSTKSPTRAELNLDRKALDLAEGRLRQVAPTTPVVALASPTEMSVASTPSPDYAPAPTADPFTQMVQGYFGEQGYEVEDTPIVPEGPCFIYRAKEIRRGRPVGSVAIKVANPLYEEGLDYHQQMRDTADYWRALGILRRRVPGLARLYKTGFIPAQDLQRHVPPESGFVLAERLTGLGEARVGLHYQVMEFVEGENLQRRLAERFFEDKDLGAAIELVINFINGVRRMHRGKIVHAELLPQNIVMDDNMIALKAVDLDTVRTTKFEGLVRCDRSFSRNIAESILSQASEKTPYAADAVSEFFGEWSGDAVAEKGLPAFAKALGELRAEIEGQGTSGPTASPDFEPAEDIEGSIAVGLRDINRARGKFVKGTFTRREFEEMRGVSKTTAQSELKGLVRLGILKVDRSERTFKYELTENYRRAPPEFKRKLHDDVLKGLRARPDSKEFGLAKREVTNILKVANAHWVLENSAGPLGLEERLQALRTLTHKGLRRYDFKKATAPTEVDMHNHTYHSDGLQSPAKVVYEAYSRGLKAIAITDHNSLEGILEAIEAGRILGVEVIPGVEVMTSDYDEFGTEILVYWPDSGKFLEWYHSEESKEFREKIKRMVTRQEDLFHKALRDLKKDYPELEGLTMKDVMDVVKHEPILPGCLSDVLGKKFSMEQLNRIFGRSDITKKYDIYEKVVSRYMDKYKVKFLGPETALRLARRSGGMAVLAHPKQYLNKAGGRRSQRQRALREYVRRLHELGLQGIQVNDWRNDEEDRAFFAELAEEFNLVQVSGSDSHGGHGDTVVGMGIVNRDFPRGNLDPELGRYSMLARFNPRGVDEDWIVRPDGAKIHRTARVDPGCIIKGPHTVICAGAVVPKGSKISNAIVMPGAHVTTKVVASTMEDTRGWRPKIVFAAPPTASPDKEGGTAALAKRGTEEGFDTDTLDVLKAMFRVAGAEVFARRLEDGSVRLRLGRPEVRGVEKGATTTRFPDGTHELVYLSDYMEEFEGFLDVVGTARGTQVQAATSRDHLLKTTRNIGHELGETLAKDYLAGKYGRYNTDDPRIEAAGILSEIILYHRLYNALSTGEDPWHDLELADEFNVYMDNVSPHLGRIRRAMRELEASHIAELLENAQSIRSDSELGALLKRKFAEFAALDERGFADLRNILDPLINPTANAPTRAELNLDEKALALAQRRHLPASRLAYEAKETGEATPSPDLEKDQAAIEAALSATPDTKICFVLGTRPEIIKLWPVISYCQRHNIPYFILHTNQHYSKDMSESFFEGLGIPPAKYNLHRPIELTDRDEMLDWMSERMRPILQKEKPSVVFVQGDTNSVLAGARAASGQRIPVGHIEAGLRSYDMSMPEEHNRIETGRLAAFHFCPTGNQTDVLRREGSVAEVPQSELYVTGNTVVDSINMSLDLMDKDPTLVPADLLKSVGVEPKNYFLLTMHRPGNVDDEKTLRRIVDSLAKVAEEHNMPILFFMHPRTKARLEKFNIPLPDSFIVRPPMDNYFAMLRLEQNARLILTDSGGIQEESCVLQVPCVVLRENTERSEAVEAGAAMLAGSDPSRIEEASRAMLAKEPSWQNPFGVGRAAEYIVKAALGMSLPEDVYQGRISKEDQAGPPAIGGPTASPDFEKGGAEYATLVNEAIAETYGIADTVLEEDGVRLGCYNYAFNLRTSLTGRKIRSHVEVIYFITGRRRLNAHYVVVTEEGWKIDPAPHLNPLTEFLPDLQGLEGVIMPPDETRFRPYYPDGVMTGIRPRFEAPAQKYEITVLIPPSLRNVTDKTVIEGFKAGSVKDITSQLARSFPGMEGVFSEQVGFNRAFGLLVDGNKIVLTPETDMHVHEELAIVPMVEAESFVRDVQLAQKLDTGQPPPTASPDYMKGDSAAELAAGPVGDMIRQVREWCKFTGEQYPGCCVDLVRRLTKQGISARVMQLAVGHWYVEAQVKGEDYVLDPFPEGIGGNWTEVAGEEGFVIVKKDSETAERLYKGIEDKKLTTDAIYYASHNLEFYKRQKSLAGGLWSMLYNTGHRPEEKFMVALKDFWDETDRRIAELQRKEDPTASPDYEKGKTEEDPFTHIGYVTLDGENKAHIFIKIHDKDSRYITLSTDQEKIGLIELGLDPDKGLCIKYVAVEEGLQGQGFSHALLDAAFVILQRGLLGPEYAFTGNARISAHVTNEFSGKALKKYGFVAMPNPESVKVVVRGEVVEVFTEYEVTADNPQLVARLENPAYDIHILESTTPPTASPDYEPADRWASPDEYRAELETIVKKARSKMQGRFEGWAACHEHAFCLRDMLRENGIGAQVKTAYFTPPGGGRLEAHYWVEAEGGWKIEPFVQGHPLRDYVGSMKEGQWLIMGPDDTTFSPYYSMGVTTNVNPGEVHPKEKVRLGLPRELSRFTREGPFESEAHWARDIIDELVQDYPGMRQAIFDREGRISTRFIVDVDGMPSELEQEVRQELAIVPVIRGGPFLRAARLYQDLRRMAEEAEANGEVLVVGIDSDIGNLREYAAELLEVLQRLGIKNLRIVIERGATLSAQMNRSMRDVRRAGGKPRAVAVVKEANRKINRFAPLENKARLVSVDDSRVMEGNTLNYDIRLTRIIENSVRMVLEEPYDKIPDVREEKEDGVLKLILLPKEERVNMDEIKRDYGEEARYLEGMA